jgi:hypothetical protein
MSERKLLPDEKPLLIQATLIQAVGLNEAIFLQQVHFWLGVNENKRLHAHDGRYWCYNTYEAWQANDFPFWSTSTIKRTIQSLKKAGLLLVGNYNRNKHDRTQWYSIDYDAVTASVAAARKKPVPLGQVDPSLSGQEPLPPSGQDRPSFEPAETTYRDFSESSSKTVREQKPEYAVKPDIKEQQEQVNRLFKQQIQADHRESHRFARTCSPRATYNSIRDIETEVDGEEEVANPFLQYSREDSGGPDSQQDDANRSNPLLANPHSEREDTNVEGVRVNIERDSAFFRGAA